MNIEIDDYFWINVFLDEKVITMNRSSLNDWARRYGLTPGDYKNKRLLLLSMLDLWENLFDGDPEFKENYFEYHGHPH